MDKHELVELTIERLLANFERSPESFILKLPDHNSYGGPMITWKPRLQIGNYDASIVDDPNNNHAIVMSYNPGLNELSCWIFLKAPAIFDGAKADHVMSTKGFFIRLSRPYRKFKKLMRLIKARDNHKNNMDYLGKLSAVFPDTLDKHFLKD